MRYLAIDFGEKRTGLAVCDADETIASPLVVLEGQGALPERIAEVVKSQQVDAVLLGLPLNMDGTEGGQVKRVRKFAGELSGYIDVEIEFFDERLSSFDAESKFVGSELTRKKKKKRLDAVAAASILQSFLESRRQSDL
jgi:putative Holliday junction resolvase